jgi:altronate hydrolase
VARDDRLLLLDPSDDCVVARVPLPAGEWVVIGGRHVRLGGDLGVGHKLAARALQAGEPVRKCGAVIGRTTAAVAAGEHLHLHNLRSEYLAAHLVGGASVGAGETGVETGRTGGGPAATGGETGRTGGVPAATGGETGPTGGEMGEAGGTVEPAPLAARPAAGSAAAARSGDRRGAAGAQEPLTWQGFARADGRLGIRNHLLVVYTVECAHHVAAQIARTFEPGGTSGVQVLGFPGCYPNEYAQRVLTALATHPNVGGALLVSLGCESFDSRALLESVRASGRWAERLVIQEEGGTAATVAAGRELVHAGRAAIATMDRVAMSRADLVVGTICGGSDSTSLLSANPAVGRAFDRLVAAGAACIFEETGELIGCEEHLRSRAVDPVLGAELASRVEKAASYYEQLGHASIAPGNLAGGLTTIEEKSIGAYAKSGSSPISGVIEPGELPPGGGLYLLDVVPDGPARFGYPNINDTTEVVELIACGSHVVLFTTGRGSVVGSVVSPVVKVCANPDTYRRMRDDMDVDAGRILLGAADLDAVGLEIDELVARTASGEPTRSEALGHQEFQLGYKVFRSLEPSCLA